MSVNPQKLIIKVLSVSYIRVIVSYLIFNVLGKVVNFSFISFIIRKKKKKLWFVGRTNI